MHKSLWVLDRAYGNVGDIVLRAVVISSRAFSYEGDRIFVIRVRSLRLSDLHAMNESFIEIKEYCLSLWIFETREVDNGRLF